MHLDGFTLLRHWSQEKFLTFSHSSRYWSLSCSLRCLSHAMSQTLRQRSHRTRTRGLRNCGSAFLLQTQLCHSSTTAIHFKQWKIFWDSILTYYLFIPISILLESLKLFISNVKIFPTISKQKK